MKIAGIVLIIVEIIAILSCLFISGGGIPTNPAELFGFCLPGIIGIVLLVKGSRKAKNKD